MREGMVMKNFVAYVREKSRSTLMKTARPHTGFCLRSELDEAQCTQPEKGRCRSADNVEFHRVIEPLTEPAGHQNR